jgi:hypothetical protein
VSVLFPNRSPLQPTLNEIISAATTVCNYDLAQLVAQFPHMPEADAVRVCANANYAAQLLQQLNFNTLDQIITYQNYNDAQALDW